MFRIFYAIAIRLYGFGILAASFFNSKAKQWITGRKGQWERIKANLPANEHKVWFHCSSLGEFEQGRPVIEEYKKRVPNAFIVLTFFSPSGFEVRKNYEYADVVLYLPLDLKKNAAKFVDLIKPKLAVFVKYDFWFNFLYQLWYRNIPLFLISANFRDNQWFFKRPGRSFRKVLGFYSHIFVQDELSLNILKKFDVKNITVAGDTRVDRVYNISAEVDENKLIEKFTKTGMVVVAGSTWEKDEELIIDYINRTKHNIKWVIAPHEVNNDNVSRIQKSLSGRSVRYSTLMDHPDNDADIVVIDNIGLLSSLYRYGKIAYIGGGFGKGIHNILEPATFGLPIIFGPKYKKFREALFLKEKGGAIPVNNYHDLEKIFNKLVENDKIREKTGKISRSFITRNLGSSQLIVDKMLTK